MADLTTHVHPSDVLAAVRYLHGPQTSVLCYRAEGATTSVQGFLSLMLRVKVDFVNQQNNTDQCSIVVKMKPTREDHLNMVAELNTSEREIIYYNKILPFLRSKIPNLPIVTCYAAYGTTLVMEDLCASGFQTLGKSMKDIADGVVDLARTRFVARNLAKLHVASLGVDWPKLFPELLETDPIYETGDMFKSLVKSGFKSVTMIMNEILPEDKCSKYVKWLLSDCAYESASKLSKPSSTFLNVLNHGDCWANNMMFKIDPATNKPTDLKFFDLQMFRFAPPTRDLMYFLYACTRRGFRDAHEKDMLRAYVDAFNTLVCDTPDILSFDQLFNEYDRSRMFGLSTAVVTKPFILTHGFMPEEGEQLSKEFFDKMNSGDLYLDTLDNFRDNALFKEEMIEIMEELMVVMDKEVFD